MMGIAPSAGWLTMESAPADETVIVGLWPRNPTKTRWSSATIWWDSIGGEWVHDESDNVVEPLYWVPLPTPPKAATT